MHRIAHCVVRYVCWIVCSFFVWIRKGKDIVRISERDSPLSSSNIAFTFLSRNFVPRSIEQQHTLEFLISPRLCSAFVEIRVNDISYIFFFSADITSRFLSLQVAMIPQVSESIFNVENSVVVPASCIFKNSINKMRIWFLDTIRPLSLLPRHMYKEQRKQNVNMIPVVISYSSSFNLAFFFFLLSSSSSFSSSNFTPPFQSPLSFSSSS